MKIHLPFFFKKKNQICNTHSIICANFYISFSALLVRVIALQTEGGSAKSDTHFKLVLERILGIAWVQHQNYHDWCYLASNINDASCVLMLPRPAISAVSNILMCNPQTLICKTFTKNRKGRETHLSKENLNDAKKISCRPKWWTTNGRHSNPIWQVIVKVCEIYIGSKVSDFFHMQDFIFAIETII